MEEVEKLRLNNQAVTGNPLTLAKPSEGDVQKISSSMEETRVGKIPGLRAKSRFKIFVTGLSRKRDNPGLYIKS